MERKKMSNTNFCDTDFNTLGENTLGANTLGGNCNEPVSDLTLSTMVVGNQEALFCKLIMVLLFLYAWTNQSFISYLMCLNEKFLCNQSCLTDKLVDSVLDSLADCRSDLADCKRRRNH
jgi:hypothetical protein